MTFIFLCTDVDSRSSEAGIRFLSKPHVRSMSCSDILLWRLLKIAQCVAARELRDSIEHVDLK